MKLLIKHQSFDDDAYWSCELTDAESIWIGDGDTPIEAYECYLDLVKELDEAGKGHKDYDWCKSKGLIK